MNTLSLFNLKGKTALITGSGSGIGYSIAEGLAGAGAKIILNGRNEEKLETAKIKIHKQGFRAETLIFDVTDLMAAKKAVKSYEENSGAIDILVNNAGIN